jgi:hypothetical protein
LQFFGVNQVAMLIHASLKTRYIVKSKVVKSEATTLNLRYAKQQPSRIQGKKWLPNGTLCKQIGKQLQFNGEKWQQDVKISIHQLLIS